MNWLPRTGAKTIVVMATRPVRINRLLPLPVLRERVGVRVFTTSLRLGFCNLFLGRGDDRVGGEPEFLAQIFQRGAGAEGLHPDRLAGASDVSVPAECARGFHAHARGH